MPCKVVSGSAYIFKNHAYLLYRKKSQLLNEQLFLFNMSYNKNVFLL